MESVTHVVLGTRGTPDARRPHRTRHHARRTGSRVILIVLGIRRVYLPLFPSAKVKMVAFFGIFFKRFTVPAWAFLPYWIVLQVTSVAFGGDDGWHTPFTWGASP